MKLGDKVFWKSQSQGFWKEKSGEIVEVVPARQYPKLKVPGSWTPNGWVCFTRLHESYLVKTSERVYWPKVSSLSVTE